MSLVRIVFAPEVGWSTTARRNGTSTWPGPARGSDDDASLNADLHHQLCADHFAVARGAHEDALIFKRHRVVAAVRRRRRNGQGRGALANVDQRAIDIGLLRIDDRPRFVRRASGREEIFDLVFQGGQNLATEASRAAASPAAPAALAAAAKYPMSRWWQVRRIRCCRCRCIRVKATRARARPRPARDRTPISDRLAAFPVSSPRARSRIACPGRDPGSTPAFGQDHAQIRLRSPRSYNKPTVAIPRRPQPTLRRKREERMTEGMVKVAETIKAWSRPSDGHRAGDPARCR